MLKRTPGPSEIVLLAASFLLWGCGTRDNLTPQAVVAGKQGMVHGGQQPVSGATIQLYAVGTNGTGSAATPLLTSAVTTDAQGTFLITRKYTCPSSTTLVYLTATGGNPGLPAGGSNPALAMMAALGSCGTLSASTFIFVNELTTVAAVSAVAPYMSSLSAIGSGSGGAPILRQDFALAAQLVNTATGSAPGTNVPSGATVPVAQLNTLADIIAGCINSAGGAAGDGSLCGNLFSLTAVPAGSTAPNDTIAALLAIANNPTVNVGALYNLIAPTSPFQPILSQAPPDLKVRLLVSSGLTVSPAALSFPQTRVNTIQAAQTLTITNTTAAPVSISAANPSYLSFLGANPGDFGVDTWTCYSPLPAGASCTVSLYFEPSATGPRSAYFVLANSSANPSIAVPLDGQGLPLGSGGPAALSTDSLNLQAAGTPSNVTLTNSGTGPVTVDRIGISNDPTSGQPAFTETDNCVGTLAGGAACTIAVTALSTTQLYSTGVLTVYDDAPAGVQKLNLSFSNGFAGPIQLNYPDLSVGQSITSTLSNISGYGGPFTVTITGPQASDFSFSTTASVQTTTCTGTRTQPNCQIPITFTPSAQGLRLATISVSGNPFGGLVGNGIAPGLHFTLLRSPIGNPTPITSLDFGRVVQGQSINNNVTLGVLNNGTVPLALNAPTISGAGAGEFTQTTNCTSVLAPGGTCYISITVMPTQIGPFTATLNLADTTGVATVALPLQASGLPPAPTVTPAELDFGYVAQGSVSAPLSFTITANNNDPVIVQGDPAVAAKNPFVLTKGNSCSRTPCQLAMVYAPTSATYTNNPGGYTYGGFYIYDQVTYQYTLLSPNGTYVAPYVLSASPMSLYFASPSGYLEGLQTVTLSNTGSQQIHYTFAFNAAGTVTTDPNFQVQADSTEQIVQPGDTDTFVVGFYPAGTTHGNVATTLYVRSQAATIAIPLSGTAP